MTTDTADPLVLDRTTLSGDVRDHLLDFLKHNKDVLPWNALPEARQQEHVERAQAFAAQLVERVVGIVAADGREPLAFQVRSVSTTDRGQIEIKLQAAFTSPAWAALGQAQQVQLVVADPRAYLGERRPGGAHVRPDEPPLPLAAEAPAPKARRKRSEPAVTLEQQVATRMQVLIDHEELTFDAALDRVCVDLEIDAADLYLDIVRRHLGAPPAAAV